MRLKNIRSTEHIKRLRIQNKTTAPTGILVTTEVEELDMLSRHDSRVVEDECDVS